jgi:hypothetical protein
MKAFEKKLKEAAEKTEVKIKEVQGKLDRDEFINHQMSN